MRCCETRTAQCEEILEVAAQKYLSAALSTLENVYEVTCSGRWDFPTWIGQVAIDSLISLPRLRILSLSSSTDVLPLPKHLFISPLQSLTIASGMGYRFWKNPSTIPSISRFLAGCPRLEHLELHAITDGPNTNPPLLDSLLAEDFILPLDSIRLTGFRVEFHPHTLQHFRSLTSFDMYQVPASMFTKKCPNSYSDFDRIWSVFKSEKIFLSELMVDAISHSLVDYLTAYSGLAYLQIGDFSDMDLAVSNKFAKIFLDEVLPRHAESLQSCWVQTKWRSKWCYGGHWNKFLETAERLETLVISLDPDATNDADDGSLRKLVTFVINSTNVQSLHLEVGWMKPDNDHELQEFESDFQLVIGSVLLQSIDFEDELPNMIKKLNPIKGCRYRPFALNRTFTRWELQPPEVGGEGLMLVEQV
ncbi:hypothetical protein AX16_005836 [Volvariella volvacea WC 439]|nr:hypothetical protein AX16_005836 [Volvariella volvacea WC 439]